jgi:hypothetical protein
MSGRLDGWREGCLMGFDLGAGCWELGILSGLSVCDI